MGLQAIPEVSTKNSIIRSLASLVLPRFFQCLNCQQPECLALGWRVFLLTAPVNEPAPKSVATILSRRGQALTMRPDLHCCEQSKPGVSCVVAQPPHSPKGARNHAKSTDTGLGWVGVVPVGFDGSW